jgi:hypothetical protein
MPIIIEQLEDEQGPSFPTLRDLSDIVDAHDAFLHALDGHCLSPEQEIAAAMYHDALCWVLGNPHARLPAIVVDLYETRPHRNPKAPSFRKPN